MAFIPPPSTPGYGPGYSMWTSTGWRNDWVQAPAGPKGSGGGWIVSGENNGDQAGQAGRNQGPEANWQAIGWGEQRDSSEFKPTTTSQANVSAGAHGNPAGDLAIDPTNAHLVAARQYFGAEAGRGGRTTPDDIGA